MAIPIPKGEGAIVGVIWRALVAFAVVYAKTAEPVKTPFGVGWLMWAKEACIRRESRLDESICHHNGWQDGDVAFCQNSLTTRYYYL